MGGKHKPCPNCGKELEFSAKHNALFCRHCESQQTIIRTSDFSAENSDYLQTLSELDEQAEVPEYIVANCENCGAEQQFPENVTADRCQYCDSPIVAAEYSTRPLRPSAVLPFKITREDALQHFRQWLSSRWFLPSKIKKQARIDKFKGIYLPYWTYDCETSAPYTGQRGEYYYVTVSYTTTVNGKTVQRTRQERRTRWYPAAGMIKHHFINILVPANHSLPEKLVRELEPWGLAELEEYQPDLIRGNQEQSYAVPLAAGFSDAQRQIEPRVREFIRRDIGGDEQRIYTVNIINDNIKFKLILLPTWVNLFQFHNQQFIFLVNARTGEVQGERPWSAWKITFFTFFMLAIVAAIIVFFIH